MTTRAFATRMSAAATLAIALIICMTCAVSTAFAETDSTGQTDLVATTPDAGDTANTGTDPDLPSADVAKPFTGKGIYYITASSSKKLVFGMKNDKRVNGTPTVLARMKDTNLLKYKLVPVKGQKGLYCIENFCNPDKRTGRRNPFYP